MKIKISPNFIALSPLALFVVVFIGSGFYFTLKNSAYAFYQVSASVAILPAIILSFFLSKEPPAKTLSLFLEGVRDKNIIIMCLIYLLAGAFTHVLQNMGGVSSTVNFALAIIPNKASLSALFLISATMATAMGTSMGTIAAIGPIGVGLANSVGMPLPLAMGAIIGGAMFGDNLSMISDTTIAATQIHGCSILDKFKSNTAIALPAMLATIIVLMLIGWSSQNLTLLPVGPYQLVKSLPYLVVLTLALLGKNVFVVLILGIISAGSVGIFTVPEYSLTTFSQNIFAGYQSMTEILILSLLMGGLGELIKQQGGFALITRSIDRFIFNHKTKNPKGAETAISVIASFSDICTANNTAAIILSGEATREIALHHGVAPVRAATLVNLFSCVFQGILPYSAQVLMAGSLAGISPLQLLPHIYYCYFLGIAGIAAILLQFPKFSVSRLR
jgi:Na+/H+ antiporter NhaC